MKSNKFIRFFLWNFYIWQCIGALAIISGGLMWLRNRLQNWNLITQSFNWYERYFVVCFFIGLVIVTFQYSIDLINEAWYEMKQLEQEAKPKVEVVKENGDDINANKPRA